MTELGQTSEPGQLIPGNAGAIDENVVAIRGRGQTMENAGNGLKKIDGGAWIGAAGDAFREQFSYEPRRWFEAADAFQATADALSGYAGTLRWAQGQAAEAIRLWDEGQAATKQAKDAHDRAVAAADTQSMAGQPAVVPPFFDPGEAKRQVARDTLNGARQQLVKAGDDAAKTIRAEGDKAPEQSGWDAFWGGVGDVLDSVGSFLGGIKDGAVQMVTDLGALIGRDPTTGEWSWSTAGAAWKGLGTFALALGAYATPVGALLDQTIGLPGFERGQLGNTLLAAGKSLIAYDQWGEDPARAAGTATFNIVSAILGTKGAGGALRAVGAAAQSSRVAAVSTAGTALVRSGEFIGRLPTVDGLVNRVTGRSPGSSPLSQGTAPRIDVPHHVDTPVRVGTPTRPTDLSNGARTPEPAPTPGSIGDALSRTPDAPTRPPSTPGADPPASRGVDVVPTHSSADTVDVPGTSSGDRTPALVGVHADSSAPAAHTSTGSGTDVPIGNWPDSGGAPPVERAPEPLAERAPGGDAVSPGERPSDDATSHGDGDHPDGGELHADPDHDNSRVLDAPSDGRSETDQMPSPEPGDQSLGVLSESRVELDADGLIESVDGRPVDEYLHDTGAQRAEQFRDGRADGTINRGETGPVTAVAIDRQTGEIFEATNGDASSVIKLNDLHPLLRERLDALREAGPYQAVNKDGSFDLDEYGNQATRAYPHPDNPLGHAEVKAVNELLWRRGADVGPAVFEELRVDTHFPFGREGVRSAPCCANCSWLLEDTPSNAGRFTGYPPGPHNRLPE